MKKAALAVVFGLMVLVSVPSGFCLNNNNLESLENLENDVLQLKKEIDNLIKEVNNLNLKVNNQLIIRKKLLFFPYGSIMTFLLNHWLSRGNMI